MHDHLAPAAADGRSPPLLARARRKPNGGILGRCPCTTTLPSPLLFPHLRPCMSESTHEANVQALEALGLGREIAVLSLKVRRPGGATSPCRPPVARAPSETPPPALRKRVCSPFHPLSSLTSRRARATSAAQLILVRPFLLSIRVDGRGGWPRESAGGAHLSPPCCGSWHEEPSSSPLPPAPASAYLADRARADLSNPDALPFFSRSRSPAPIKRARPLTSQLPPSLPIHATSRPRLVDGRPFALPLGDGSVPRAAFESIQQSDKDEVRPRRS